MSQVLGRTPTGIELLNNPLWNKGTAFTERERTRLGLRGLLPAHVDTLDDQEARALEHYRAKPDDLERYIYLTALHDTNETLFYRLLLDHLEEMMPIVYTPTVGKACQLYGHLFRRARGMFVSALDRGHVAEVLDNWPGEDVRAIVVTDGGRILGLGDLGASGMGIPVGKLVLYSACAGLPPRQTLPVTLDVGTDNPALREDPLYLGIRRPRLKGEEYDALIEEFVQAATSKWPRVLIQFEDFANTNSFRLLHRYRDRICTFNDDIQGTAAVTVAGLYSALRITGGRLGDQRILFFGAGGAGIGIGELLVSAMVDNDGLPEEEARRRCLFFDSKGLVVRSRTDLEPQKRAFAHDLAPCADLLEAVRAIRPTALIGAAGRAKTFTREVLEEMGRLQERPIVFALSNPTSQAECTPEEAYRATGGRAIYASGSPFDPVEIDGKRLVPGQGNNAYIFPGLGLGVCAVAARHVTDEMFAAAARALAAAVDERDLEVGRVFPPLTSIREVSLDIAVAVAEVAYRRGLARVPEPEDLRSFIREAMFQPEYAPLA